MSSNSWGQLLITQQIDGTAVSNTSSQTSVLPGAAKFTLPANLLAIGTAFKIYAGGRISTVVTTPGTVTWAVKFGSVEVFNSGALAQNTTAQTNATWLLEIDLICRSIGASTSATMFGIGKYITRAAVGSAAVATSGVLVQPIPDTAPGAGTGFDSTASQQVDLLVTPSVANATNSIRSDFYELWLKN
jgi:hypothetical protein